MSYVRETRTDTVKPYGRGSCSDGNKDCKDDKILLCKIQATRWKGETMNATVT